jgi:hypothetical protein
LRRIEGSLACRSLPCRYSPAASQAVLTDPLDRKTYILQFVLRLYPAPPALLALTHGGAHAAAIVGIAQTSNNTKLKQPRDPRAREIPAVLSSVKRLLFIQPLQTVVGHTFCPDPIPRFAYYCLGLDRRCALLLRMGTDSRQRSLGYPLGTGTPSTFSTITINETNEPTLRLFFDRCRANQKRHASGPA